MRETVLPGGAIAGGFPPSNVTVAVQPGGARAAGIPPGIRISTRLLLHWGQIAIAQEREAHDARAELVRRRPEALRTGSGLDLSLELHPAMLTAAAAAAAIDALYGEIREFVIPDDQRERWRTKRTARYAQIFETLRRGFVTRTKWRQELEWLFRDQRDAALHPKTGYDVPQPHPLGVNTAPEYTIYTCEHARRAVDLMLDMLVSCVEHPRDALQAWAEGARKPVSQLVAARRT